jgi:hypothetical protein
MHHKLREFISFVKEQDGICDKSTLQRLVSEKFDLTTDRKIMYCEAFAVRFSQSSTGGFSNTVLSLSKLQKYDHIPVIVCLVTKAGNRLFLANSTFLTKVSHSSQQLTLYNIKGSFNGSDIVKTFQGLENTPANFDSLYAVHAELGFEGNLLRIVEATTGISGTGKQFEVTEEQRASILASVQVSIDFCKHHNYIILKQELDGKVKKYRDIILVASHIENHKIRSGIIEYLIAGNDEALKEQLVREIESEYSKLPHLKSQNSLGDYQRVFPEHFTETDVKTKILILNSNPKGYSIDKFLEFQSRPNSVFLFYFIGIDSTSIVNTVLISVFQRTLIHATQIMTHWSGRNSRGHVQFIGESIHQLILDPDNTIEKAKATEFLEKLLAIK